MNDPNGALAPTLGDGDDDNDEELAESSESVDLYRPTDPDEIRRAFIVEKVVSPETACLKGLVDCMDSIHNWLRDGTLQNKQTKLKVVPPRKSEEDE